MRVGTNRRRIVMPSSRTGRLRISIISGALAIGLAVSLVQDDFVGILVSGVLCLYWLSWIVWLFWLVGRARKRDEARRTGGPEL